MAYEPLIGQARLAKRMRKEMQCDPQWVLDLAAERDALKHALDVKEEFYQDALHSHVVLREQRDQLRAEVEKFRGYCADLDSEKREIEHKMDAYRTSHAEVKALRKDAEIGSIAKRIARELHDSPKSALAQLTRAVGTIDAAMAAKGGA